MDSTISQARDTALSATPSLLDAAISYTGRGWQVIPLHDVMQGHCSCEKGTDCESPGKHPRVPDWPHKATTKGPTLRAWWRQWPQANVGVVPGQRSGVAIVDVDPRNGGGVALEELQHTYGRLPDTPLVLSGGGGQHYYFQTSEDLPSVDLAPGINFLADGSHQAVAPPSLHPSGAYYEWEASSHPDDVPLAPLPDWIVARVKETVHKREIAAATLPEQLPPVEVAALRVSPRIQKVIRLGDDPERPYPSRSEALAAVYTAMFAAGYDDVTIAAVVLNATYGISAKPLDRKHPRSPFYWTQTKGWVAQDIARVRAKYVLGQNGQQPNRGLSSLSSLSSYTEWPHIAPDAFHGLAGEIVQAITPHSEADPVALLSQLLAYFGVIIGRSAYYEVEATRHYTNLDTVLVGPTAKGRKGTSYDQIERIMQTIDTSWTTANLCGGCGSGEGLIAAVRDKTVKREPIKQRGRITGYQDVEVDPGVIDKRLLVYESEFASVLKIGAREGNILSVTLRQAWDNGNLRQTVKNNPLKATGAHIAVIGHITIEELHRTLTTTEAANGFGNRFLWLCVRRSKSLPDGGELHSVNFAPLIGSLRNAFEKARIVTRMTRDEAAKAAWHAVYPTLSDERPGLVGALLARGEAQVLRLSMLYALLDGSEIIKAEHLYAALALWEYVEASAAYIFGETLGDPAADTLLAALQACYPEGLNRKAILEETFHRNLRADDLDRVLRTLHSRGCITLADLPPEGGHGRPKHVVTYHPYELNELNELNQGGYLALAKQAVAGLCLHPHTVETESVLVCQDCGLQLAEVL